MDHTQEVELVGGPYDGKLVFPTMAQAYVIGKGYVYRRNDGGNFHYCPGGLWDFSQPMPDYPVRFDDGYERGQPFDFTIDWDDWGHRP